LVGNGGRDMLTLVPSGFKRKDILDGVVDELAPGFSLVRVVIGSSSCVNI
jgi:hypothetical protein